MRTKIRHIIARFIASVIGVIDRTRFGEYALHCINRAMMSRVMELEHMGCSMLFSTPNPICKWRINTFATKEPETIAWIDSVPEGSVFWDIGANVGLFSVYAAKARSCFVWAFEPSVFNLELLARNTFINGLSSRICIVPLPLNDQICSNTMIMSSTEWGGALSSFGQNFGWYGQKMRKIFEYTTQGITIDDAVESLKIPCPDYIKLDVDGIEHLILNGGKTILGKVKGILLEVNDDFLAMSNSCQKTLLECGLALVSKQHSAMLEGSSPGFHNSYNQIWARPVVN